jgi:Domain of unknown function (DUF4412)
MKKLLLPLILACIASPSAPAQLPGMGSLPTTAPGSDFATFSQLFGKTAAFTARSEVRVLDKNQKETINTAMDFAMLDNKLRLEIDTAATQNKDMPGAAEGLKQMGMDQVCVIMRPDRQTVYFSFPKAKMHIAMPMEKNDLEKAEKSTIQTEALGKETLDGHPCVKHKITITSSKGEKQEITAWNATDLKDFPIQTIQKQGDDTITTRYTKIQFAKPDAKQFEPPAGSQEFKGMAEFMQGMMQKALGGAAPGAN